MSSSLLDRILVGGHACSAIIIGHYAGLWAVLAAHPGRVWSIAELADEAGCKERSGQCALIMTNRLINCSGEMVFGGIWCRYCFSSFPVKYYY